MIAAPLKHFRHYLLLADVRLGNALIAIPADVASSSARPRIASRSGAEKRGESKIQISAPSEMLLYLLRSLHPGSVSVTKIRS